MGCRHQSHIHSNTLPLIIVDLYHSVIDPIHIKSIDEIKRERQVQYQVSSAKQLHHDKIINAMGMLSLTSLWCMYAQMLPIIQYALYEATLTKISIFLVRVSK